MRRSKHNLSHSRLASFDMGQLVPVSVVEVLPGDTFRHSSSVLLRLASLANPLMHEISVRLHHWYVPNRCTYDNCIENGWVTSFESGHLQWEKFINGSDSTLALRGLDLDASEVTAGTLANHLGIPVSVTDNTNVNVLPFAAYQLIWDTFYRDQDVQDSILAGNEGQIVAADATVLRRICWEKDYFTTCRTDPQFGSAVSIPFEAGLQAPVKGIGTAGTMSTIQTNGTNTRESGGGTRTYTNYANEMGDTDEIRLELSSDVEASARPTIYADLAEATGGGIDVNEFRRAIALQKFLEARNRYGSRYRDYLRYLGIRPSDGRLEQPEYLGGGKQTIAVSEVLATADSATSEVGDMSGHGIAALRTRPYTKFFEEHGYVISLLSVRPRAMYQQMLQRHWFRNTKDDFWQKEYELFGPQAVLTKEVYGLHANETDVFGYQDRFREYREHPSYVSGLFSTTLDDWHLAREFGSAPSLDSTFVECTPSDRIYNDANQPECYAQVRHSLVARRLVSKLPRV